MTIDLDAYFQRVGYQGERRASLPVLAALHYAHAVSVPFENLSSFSGASVSLALEEIERKLVHDRRGGYCYEQNLLFNAVLQALGFSVEGFAARVRWRLPADAPLPPRTHMLLQVTIEGEPWLVDVGFGGLTQTAPLRLVPGLVQATPHEPFRVSQLNGHDYLLEARIDGDWQPLYEFDTRPQLLMDYVVSNWYISTHPESRFVKQLVAALPAPDGRHTLLDNRYSRHYLEASSEHRLITDPDELHQLLTETFAINVPADSALRNRLAELALRPSDPASETLATAPLRAPER